MLNRELSAWISMISTLPRLRSYWGVAGVESAVVPSGGGAEAALEAHRQMQKISMYSSVVSRLNASQLHAVFDQIENKVGEASLYANTWLQYQAMWDMDMERVAASLGDDLPRWSTLLKDMKKAAAAFDQSDSVFDSKAANAAKRFGPIVIEYGSVAAKVNNRHDRWHKDVLNRFGSMLMGLRKKLFDAMVSARNQLESKPMELSTTAEMVESITLQQTILRAKSGWEVDMNQHADYEKLLQRHRFQFPTVEWVGTESLKSVYSVVEQLLNKRQSRLKEEESSINSRLMEEEAALERRIQALLSEWKAKKPSGNESDYRAVISLLSGFSKQLDRIEEDVDKINKTKRALEMKVSDEVRTQWVRDELTGLSRLWDALGFIWREMEEFGEKLFRDIKAQEMREKLRSFIDKIDQLPNEFRQYESTTALKAHVKGKQDSQNSIMELKAGFLRPKHLKMILTALNLSSKTTWDEMTLNQMWGANIKAKQKDIRVILDQAQGESALEEYLNEIAESWNTTNLELVDYRGKSHLIKNFETLSGFISDKVSDLKAMAQSPWFRAFERDAEEWTGRLQLAGDILDVFVDVQRRWVYLEGIFSGSADVKVQLAQQYRKFSTFDKEFVKMMRDMSKDPLIDPWVKRDRGLHPKLESYLETLIAIEKALGEYLEDQRNRFPRFYFVGDEDLLDIVGNAKNPLSITRHYPKMFAGITCLGISPEGNQLINMSSREGELVPFTAPVLVGESISVQEWLGNVEKRMRLTWLIWWACRCRLCAAGAR